MKPKYRVEAFIVPKSSISQDESSISCSSNEMDDVKAANKFIKNRNDSESKEDQSNLSDSRETLNDLKIKLKNEDIDEPIYEIPYVQIAPFTNNQRSCKYKSCETTISTKIPIRTSSLMSIDERGETDGILEEFCFHGYKYGCSAPVQRPEQVSEEIFKENWLRRLESLREREASLRDKEILLEEREKLLFNKERELRILERLVNEKLKRAELFFKRSKSSQSIDSGSRDSSGSQRSSNNFNTKINSQSLESCNSSSQIKKTEPTRILDPFRYSREEPVSLARYNNQMKQSVSSLSSGNSSEEKSSTKSLVAPIELAKSHGGRSSNFIAKSSSAGFSAYSSLRCKPRPKMSYDDLDSTLSADIGDSSFVVTSKKFDPELFKKPYAFTRSASERRSTHEQENNCVYKTELRDKLLKRVSENIFTSQDKSTTYQNYGLIDPGSANSLDLDDARESNSNLERINDAANARISRVIKERPLSWNEETNEWLRKKRHAYNMATRRIPNDDFENKENVDAAVKRERAEKCTKKTSKVNKFAIFR